MATAIEPSTTTAPAARQPRAERKGAPTLQMCVREFFSFVGPRLIAIALVGALIAKAVIGQWSWWDLAVAGGLVALWPLQEWLIHVFVLHFKPKQLGPIKVDPFVASKHRRHHADPWDLELSMTPMRAIFMILILNIAIWYGLAPTAGIAATGMLTYIALGLTYEWTHYLIHTRYRPQSKLYKHLWRNHRLHHCKNEHYWFGVSMTAADYALGTAPDQRKVETSDTCRSVHPQR